LFADETEIFRARSDKEHQGDSGMLATEAVEIGSGNAVACSRRLLSAIHGGNLQTVKQELARAARVSGTQLPRNAQSAMVEEQKELLGAIIERMNVSIAGYEPCAEAELFLLGHLARQ
jgi:hypothetical protein